MGLIDWIATKTIGQIKSLLYAFNIDKWSCRHCKGTGVCTAGYEVATKYSCSSCIKAFDPSWNGITTMQKVKCSVCNGTGKRPIE